MRFSRKVQIKTSEFITICYLHDQGIELFRRRLVRIPHVYQLAFANRMHNFHTGDRTAGRPKGFETQHGAHNPLHCSMVLLHKVIQIFRVAHNKGGLVRLVVVRDRCRIGPTLIDRDFPRQPLAANGFV